MYFKKRSEGEKAHGSPLESRNKKYGLKIKMQVHNGKGCEVNVKKGVKKAHR